MNVCFYTVWFRKKKLLTAEQISTSIEALLPVIEQTSRRTLILSIICIQLNGSGNHKPARLLKLNKQNHWISMYTECLQKLEAQRDRPGQQLYIVHSEDTIPTSTKETQRIQKYTILNYESFWIFFTPFIMHLYIKVHIKAYELKNQNLV
jgi:hypothetical protein